jgi:CheY-like chemotaxis protein
MIRRRDGPAGHLGRILIVEDSPSARRLLQDVLLRLGAELRNLRVAGTIVEALTVFSEWRPEVVFIDVELRTEEPSVRSSGIGPASPRDPADGAELAVLFLTRRPGVRVIICSASDPSDPRVARLVKERKVEFIMKPLLAARVENILTGALPSVSRSSA